MSKRVVALAFVLATIVLASSASRNNADPWVVRPDGFGPVKIGMTLEQVNAALQEHFSLPQQDDDQGCFFVRSSSHRQVSFMIEKGRLARVDVNAPGIPTIAGVQVGDSEARAMTVYGRKLKSEPHRYNDGGNYLTLRTFDGRYATRFETDGNKIETFYAGRTPVVTYPDGCN